MPKGRIEVSRKGRQGFTEEGVSQKAICKWAKIYPEKQFIIKKRLNIYYKRAFALSRTSFAPFETTSSVFLLRSENQIRLR